MRRLSIDLLLRQRGGHDGDYGNPSGKHGKRQAYYEARFWLGSPLNKVIEGSSLIDGGPFGVAVSTSNLFHRLTLAFSLSGGSRR